MPEPTTVFASLKAINDARKAIEGKLENAAQLAQDDARYYSVYLDIAREAIGGLEQAYIEILVEAAHTDLANEQQRRHLLALIDGYIHGEVLRPKLKDAITHLEAGREVLRHHAGRLLIWPSARRNRSAALEQYDGLIEQLWNYLGELGDWDEESAVGLEDLGDLRVEVDQPTGAFEDKVNHLLVHLDRGNLTHKTSECALVIEALRTAFR